MLNHINVNGRGPVFEDGTVHEFPVQAVAHDRTEADILASLAAALRLRARLDGAITNMRVLAAEFQAAAQGARLTEEGARVLRGNLERTVDSPRTPTGRDISNLALDIAAANEAGDAVRAAREAARNDPDKEAAAIHRVTDRLAREDDN